jgi:hypothetical protein
MQVAGEIIWTKKHGYTEKQRMTTSTKTLKQKDAK